MATSESRTKNAARNIVWGTVNKIVLMLLPFFIRTIFIYTIGLEYLGLNSLFSSILQILSIAELGFSTAVVYSLYKPLAEHDTDVVCATMSFLHKIYLAVGSFILLAGIVVSFFLPSVIHGDVPQDVNIYYIFYLFLANTVISYFFGGYKSALLTASQRSDITSKIATALAIVQYIAQGAVLLLFRSFYAYVVVLPITSLIINLTNVYVVNRMYPEYNDRGNLTKDQIRPMIKQISGLLISRICAVSRNAIINILISSSIGLVALAIFSNYQYIETSIHSMLTIVGASILAGVGNSIVKESEQKNYQDFLKFDFLYMWIVGWFFCCLFNLYQPFMTLWVGEDKTMGNVPMALLCLVFYFTSAGDIRNTYINATGIWWQNKWRPILEVVVNIGLCFLLVKRFQVSGLLVASIVSLVFINLWFGSKVLYTEYFKEQKFLDFIVYQSKYLLVTILGTAATAAVCYFISGNLWVVLILRHIACIVVPNSIYLLFYRRSPYFKENLIPLKNKITRKK